MREKRSELNKFSPFAKLSGGFHCYEVFISLFVFLFVPLVWEYLKLCLQHLNASQSNNDDQDYCDDNVSSHQEEEDEQEQPDYKQRNRLWVIRP